jgi:hypothetical protein
MEFSRVSEFISSFKEPQYARDLVNQNPKKEKVEIFV